MRDIKIVGDTNAKRIEGNRCGINLSSGVQGGGMTELTLVAAVPEDMQWGGFVEELREVLDKVLPPLKEN